MGCREAAAAAAAAVVPAALLFAGAVHLLPLPGVLGREQLARLYGVSFNEPNTAVLMRHRAVLFGILGAFLTGSAFIPEWRPTAMAAGAASAGSFLWLAHAEGGNNAQMARVVAADKAALLALAAAAAATAGQRQ